MLVSGDLLLANPPLLGGVRRRAAGRGREFSARTGPGSVYLEVPELLLSSRGSFDGLLLALGDLSLLAGDSLSGRLLPDAGIGFFLL